MKKILTALLVISTFTGCIFAGSYQIPTEDIEYTTFNKTQYKTEYVSEFNSKEDFSRKFLPVCCANNWENTLAWRCEPASQVSIEKKKKYGPNDMFYRGGTDMTKYRTNTNFYGLLLRW